MKNYFLLITLFIVVFEACKRDDFRLESNAPVIYVTKPQDATAYNVSDTVFIKAIFSDDTRIEAYSIDVRRPDVSIFRMTLVPNFSPSVLDTFIVIPSAMPGNYQVVYYCEDPYDNITIKAVNFTASPI